MSDQELLPSDRELLQEAADLLQDGRYKLADPALHRRWARRRRVLLDQIRDRLEEYDAAGGGDENAAQPADS